MFAYPVLEGRSAGAHSGGAREAQDEDEEATEPTEPSTEADRSSGADGGAAALGPGRRGLGRGEGPDGADDAAANEEPNSNALADGDRGAATPYEDGDPAGVRCPDGDTDQGGGEPHSDQDKGASEPDRASPGDDGTEQHGRTTGHSHGGEDGRADRDGSDDWTSSDGRAGSPEADRAVADSDGGGSCGSDRAGGTGDVRMGKGTGEEGLSRENAREAGGAKSHTPKGRVKWIEDAAISRHYFD